MAEGDADFLRGGVADEVDGAGELGGEGEEANVAVGGLLEAVEEFDGGWEEEIGGVDSALGMGEEGAFEMDAEGGGFVCGGGAVDGLAEGFEGAEGGVERGGGGGGEVVAGAAGGEEALDAERPAGVADMTSSPAAPWMWMSRRWG